MKLLIHKIPPFKLEIYYNLFKKKSTDFDKKRKFSLVGCSTPSFVLCLENRCNLVRNLWAGGIEKRRRRAIQAVCRIGEPANRKVSSQTLEVGLVWDGEERKGGSRGFIITAAKNISLYNPECGQNEGDVFLFHMS